jgi:antitoxin VapB
MAGRAKRRRLGSALNPVLSTYIHRVYTGALAMKRTKTFKSGNSVAVRLPKSLGVEAGVEMTVREEKGRYIVEPVREEPRKIDLTGIYGSIPSLKPLRPEDRIMEPRELDWEGKLLKRD